MAELLEKYEQRRQANAPGNSGITEQERKEDVADRIIGSNKEAPGTTTSAQQKIDPVITTKEVAVTTEIDQDTNLRSSTTLPNNVQERSVQTFSPIMKSRGKCTNCCGGLPGCGPGHGRGCEGGCTCIPGLRIREKRFHDDEEFMSDTHIADSMEKIQYPRLYVTRYRDNRLRGGGADGDGTVPKDSRKTKMSRICRLKEKSPSLSTQSLLRRPDRGGSVSEAKERRLSRRFRRSLSSLRGRLARWEEARESCWESCLDGSRSRTGKNCVGRASVSTECVPTSYNYVIGVLARIYEHPRNFRRKQNVMATTAATAATDGTNGFGKLRRGTMDSPSLALSVPTSKCVRKGLADLVEDKRRECFAWETKSLASDDRGCFDSSSRWNFLLLSELWSKISKGVRNDHPDGYSLNTGTANVISSTSDIRQHVSENPFYLPLETMIRALHTKNGINYNSYKQSRQRSRKDPPSQALKFKRNDQIRLRGGGGGDTITICKLRHNNTNGQPIENMSDNTEITPLYRRDFTNVNRPEKARENESSCSHVVPKERVIRFREDDEHPEYRHENTRIRGGCGGSYKRPFFSSNIPTIFGRRDTQYPHGSCCSPARQQASCRATPPYKSPPTCAHARFQARTSCGHEDRSNDANGSCPCNLCGGPSCNDNFDEEEMDRCCKPQRIDHYPCQCKCQTCKGFKSCGGCGGQSCGTIYSCSGSSGGTCCFPRNTRKRAGPECCGGGSSNCGGCC